MILGTDIKTVLSIDGAMRNGAFESVFSQAIARGDKHWFEVFKLYAEAKRGDMYFAQAMKLALQRAIYSRMSMHTVALVECGAELPPMDADMASWLSGLNLPNSAILVVKNRLNEIRKRKHYATI